MILSGAALAAAGQVTETRAVSGFTGISASNVFDITVTKGAAESLVITADEKVMPYVRSEVRNGVLKLYLDNDHRPKHMDVNNLKAAVTVKELETVKLSGACKLTSDAVFTPAQFEVGLSGASSLQLAVETGKLSLEVSGASKVTLNATVKEEAEFDLSGATKVQSKLRARRLEVDMSGACNVSLSGSANEAFFDLSGASKIDAGDFTINKATVESSGGTNITLNVEETLLVRSSGSSRIRYKGSPKTFDVKTSGASSLGKIE